MAQIYFISIFGFCIFAKIMKTLATAIFVERSLENLDWVIYVLVASMFVLAIGRIIFAQNYEALGKMEKFQGVNDNQALFGLTFQVLLAVLLSSLIMNYLNADYDYIFHTPLLKILAGSAVILGYFALRHVFSLIAAFALGINFDQSFQMKTSNFYRAYSVAVLWLAVLIFYFSDFPFKMAFLIGVALILVIIRGLQFFYRFKNQTNQESKIWYYNILYLCALEILPVLVLFKFLTTW